MSRHSNYEELVIAYLKELIVKLKQSSGSLVIDEAISTQTATLYPALQDIETSVTTQTTALDTALQDIEDIINVISTNTNEIEPKLDTVVEELVKLSDNNIPLHDLVLSESKTFSDFTSITFTVFDGIADIKVGSKTITFPLEGSNTKLLGSTLTVEQISTNSVEIDATLGKVYVTIIK